MSSPSAPASSPPTPTPTTMLPRITIEYCTQCAWLLRAAYYAQELLSTFASSLREVALVPVAAGTGGVFRVVLTTAAGPSAPAAAHTLWDRAVHGGFPETKVLKRRVRDVIDPARALGHVDREKEGEPKARCGALGEGREGPHACVQCVAVGVDGQEKEEKEEV